MRPEGTARFEEVDHLRADLARSERMRRALADVIVTVGSNLGLEPLLDRVSSIIDEAYESFGAVVYLWDPEIDRLVPWVCTGYRGAEELANPRFVRGRLGNPLWDQYQLRMGEGLTGWVAEHREAVVLGREPWTDPRFKVLPELHEERWLSCLLVPILLPNQEILGVIGLWSMRPDHFTAEHLRVLTEITGLLATVIEKIKLDEELARRAKVLSFLGQLCGQLSSHRPVEELMDSAAALTAEVMASEACMVVTVDREGGRFVLRGLAPQRAQADVELGGRLPVLTPGPASPGLFLGTGTDLSSNEQLFRDLALALPERFAEAHSAPLLAGAEHLGFITCYRHQRYSSADRDLLSVIAGQVALGLLAVEGSDRHAERDPATELFGLLASGRDAHVVTPMAASLGLDLGQPHVLLQARFQDRRSHVAAGEVADRFARAAKQFVRSVEEQSPHSLLRESRGGVAGLVRMARLSGGAALQQRLQGTIDDLIERLGVSVSTGLSSACNSPGEYADAHREAVEALEIGSRLRGEGRVVRFEELGPDLYLFRMASDPRTRRDPWLRTLGPLVEHDRQKGGGLLATLDAYLEGRGNATLTAERLGVHRNTLRQRLARIEALTGIALGETHDWLPLHFAVKLARMQEGAPR